MSFFQAQAVHNAAALKPEAFGKIGKSTAEVRNLDDAIDAVKADLADTLKGLREAGRTAASPAHHSVLRKLAKL
jgi:hypothetical protein